MTPGKSTALVLTVLAYLVAGAYPIDPLPAFDNAGVRSTQDELRFTAPGIALTHQPPDWLREVIAGAPLEILIDVQTASNTQSGPARILTLSGNTGQRNITIGQAGADLVIRLRRSETMENGTPPFIVPGVFRDLKFHRIRLSVKRDTLAVTVDGVPRIETSLPAQALASWSAEYRLALGNEITFDRPWLGTLRQAVIRVDGVPFDYLAPGALEIPSTYYLRLAPRVLGVVPFRHDEISPRLWRDWIFNYLGFIPLGLMIGGMFSRRALLGATLFSLGVSLSMEAMQLFLPWRYPSVDDLVLNTLGGLTGAWLMASARASLAKT